MKLVLKEAGRALLKVLVISLLAIAIKVTGTHGLHGATAVGIAGIIAMIASLLATAQKYLPQLAFDSYLPKPFGAMLDAFIHASLGAFITAMIGILAMPDLSLAKSLILGAVIGALNAGLRAVEGTFTLGEPPFRARGVAGVPPPASP